MESPQTLHDFVLNLITDPQARSVFELDPEGALQAAGLGDITPADVQDVVPLVMDYAPLQELGGLDLPLVALDQDIAASVSSSAVAQLQSVSYQVSAATHPVGDFSVATAGAITVDQGGFASADVGLLAGLPVVGGAGVGSDLDANLSPVHDVADTLDSGVIGAVTAPATDVVWTADSVVQDVDLGTVHGLGGSGLDGVLGTSDFALNTVTGTLGTAGDLTGGLTGGLGDATGLGGVTSTVDDLTGGALGVVDRHSTDVDSAGVNSTVHEVDNSVGAITGGHGVGQVVDSATGHVLSPSDGGLLGVSDILF